MGVSVWELVCRSLGLGVDVLELVRGSWCVVVSVWELMCGS